MTALFSLIPAAAQAQGAIEAWVQRYDGPGDAPAQAYAMGMAVDGAGDVCVTGYYNPQGWATVKYSSAGVPLWTNLYDGMDAYAVAVDAIGDVYVTGGGFLWESCATLKYSSAGVPLWTNRYAGSHGSALAVDGSGNVVVVGAAAGDYLTLKYSSAGALLWARQYDGPANGNDFATGLALDASGNVYVTGRSYGNGTGTDYATVKYSSSGALLWTQRYNGPGNGQDDAWGVAVDGDGNAYVTGRSLSGSGYFDDSDSATIKYSGTGLPLWTNRYGAMVNGFDEAIAVAVDTSGNVYVTGDSQGGGTFDDYATIKYSSAGVPLWTNRYDGPAHSFDEPHALAVDASGNVYVTGISASNGAYPYHDVFATVVYSSAGELLWTSRHEGSESGDDNAPFLAVDGRGNVYITGTTTDTTDTDYKAHFTTVKYVIPPIIARQPLSRTNAVGTTASFTVQVVGGTPLSYQWRRDGTNLVDGGNLSGVTTTNLLIANVQLADAAGYSVVVTNAYGSATSIVAQLIVTIPPSPGRFTHLSYSPVTGLSFVFQDGTVGRAYRIQTSSSLAEGSWTDWMTFTYNGPRLLTDLAAVGTTNGFYRAITP